MNYKSLYYESRLEKIINRGRKGYDCRFIRYTIINLLLWQKLN